LACLSGEGRNPGGLGEAEAIAEEDWRQGWLDFWAKIENKRE
jgi:hypothetical protein